MTELRTVERYRHTNNRKNICRRMYTFEICRNDECNFAHTYDEYDPIECQFAKDCRKPFCSRYHPDIECKCKYLMRLGKCPSYFWNYHSTACIRNELIEWICSEYRTPHNIFCEKLTLIERYHSTYKAVLSILLDSIDIRDMHHAIHVTNEFITFPENIESLLETYGISDKDVIIEFVAIHNLIKV
jgi:hypothetical protein